MTREEMKELLPIMQAWAEGKIIQFRKKGTVEWVDLYEDDLRVSSAYHYRIKPEPKYRPFKTQEECWNEMLKHQPFGWIEHKETEDYYNILGICKITEITKILMSDCSCAFPELFDEFIFIDGTPFGIKEE